MILSHQHQFIFIKTRKTAGTSIEIALSKFCGEKDIITPISPADEEKRKELGYRGPQNYLAPIWGYSLRDAAKWMVHGKKRKRFFNHIPAEEIKKHIGRAIWDLYFKFCFVRNPWERIISTYFWRYKSEDRPSISDFIQAELDNPLRKSNLDLMMIDGQVAVDRVCRYENLTQELEEITRIIGLPEVPALPQAKGSFRKDKRSYREILSPEDQEKIRVAFQTEIELFGYE